MKTYLAKAVSIGAAFAGVGALSDLNWTEYNYVFGQLIDLLITIVTKLPEVAIPLVVVIVIFIIGAFIAALLGRIVSIINSKL